MKYRYARNGCKNSICVSPFEEGGWEVAYRLADDTELSSTTEQKHDRQDDLKARVTQQNLPLPNQM